MYPPPPQSHHNFLHQNQMHQSMALQQQTSQQVPLPPAPPQSITVPNPQSAPGTSVSTFNSLDLVSPSQSPSNKVNGQNQLEKTDPNYRCTWSQTRRVRNLNRPMIPVSIKIPLHEKHLWWESPSKILFFFQGEEAHS